MDQSEVAMMDKVESRIDLNQTAKILNVGLRVLSARALKFMSLLADLIIFGWAMFEPRWERILTAALFGVAMWFLTRDERNEG